MKIITTIICSWKNVHMLDYDRINISEGNDINKTSTTKECDISHYWYFLDKGLKIQPDICNGFHDALVMFVNLNDNAILNIQGVDYGCIFNGIIKSEAVNLLQKTNLKEKSEL